MGVLISCEMMYSLSLITKLTVEFTTRIIYSGSTLLFHMYTSTTKIINSGNPLMLPTHSSTIGFAEELKGFMAPLPWLIWVHVLMNNLITQIDLRNWLINWFSQGRFTISIRSTNWVERKNDLGPPESIGPLTNKIDAPSIVFLNRWKFIPWYRLQNGSSMGPHKLFLIETNMLHLGLHILDVGYIKRRNWLIMCDFWMCNITREALKVLWFCL